MLYLSSNWSAGGYSNKAFIDNSFNAIPLLDLDRVADLGSDGDEFEIQIRRD